MIYITKSVQYITRRIAEEILVHINHKSKALFEGYD